MIPFNRTIFIFDGRERSYVEEALESFDHSGNGPFTQACANRLSETTDAEMAYLTPSCTAALEMAVLALEEMEGFEVIMPSFTFPSTANAVVRAGGVPVFVDIRPDTLNLDEALIEDAITASTVAIMPVHYAGVPCDMGAINRIADRHDLNVIVDAAQALGSSHEGTPVGSHAEFECISFHSTKNISCGEGGALLGNADADTGEVCAEIQEKGTNRTALINGTVDRYTWLREGSSFLLGEIPAAVLLAQLERMEAINERRLRTWSTYYAAFADLEQSGDARRPGVPRNVTHNGHIFYLLAEPERRDAIIARMLSLGVQAYSHYVPLHSSPAGRSLGRSHGSFTVTDWAAGSIVRLPIWNGISDDEVHQVIEATYTAFGRV